MGSLPVGFSMSDESRVSSYLNHKDPENRPYEVLDASVIEIAFGGDPLLAVYHRYHSTLNVPRKAWCEGELSWLMAYGSRGSVGGPFLYAQPQ